MIYFYLMILCFVFSIAAQISVKNTFSKYSKIPAQSGLTGEQAAQKIIQMNGLDVQIEGTAGQLTDHYDPKNQILRLSEATRYNHSIAAIGVAAHEAGHAVQDGVNYLPNTIRAALVPIANIGTTAGPYLAIFGLLFHNFMIRGNIGLTIAYIGVGLYFFAFLFYLITLPVEFDASHRAIAILDASGMLSREELSGAKKVLRSAAATYVAAAATSLVSFLRIFAIVNSNKRD